MVDLRAQDSHSIMDSKGLDDTLTEIITLRDCKKGSVGAERLRALIAEVVLYQDKHYEDLYPLDVDLKEYMAEKEALNV